MNYTVSGTVPGKRVVSFGCPQCGDGLKSPLRSAGEQVNCPTCGQPVVIPGRRELDAEIAERNAADRAKVEKRVAEAAARSKAEAQKQQQADNAAEAREAQRLAKKERRANRPGVRLSSAIIVAVLTCMVTAAVIWFSVLKPMRDDLVDARRQINDLKSVVTANADAANTNLIATRSQIEKLTDHISAADRKIGSVDNRVSALAIDLSSLTSTVNYNANIANMNRLRY